MENSLKKLGGEVPPDKILEITKSYLNCKNPRKVNLGVGIYFDENGKNFVFESTKEAERRIINNKNRNQNYIDAKGDSVFLNESRNLFLNSNEDFAAQAVSGGTQGISLAGKLAKYGYDSENLLIGEPSWPNHLQIFKFLRFKINKYMHLKEDKPNYDSLFEAIKKAPKNTTMLFHVGKAHNPTGANFENWEEVAKKIKERGFFTILDCAYPGFSCGIKEDMKIVEAFLNAEISFAISISFSKIATLYKQRTGVLFVFSGGKKYRKNIESHMMKFLRVENSMTPAHGQEIVAELLSDNTLKTRWLADLEKVRLDLEHRREKLAKEAGREFSFIKNQKGLFSLLGISAVQVEELKNKYGIFLTEDGRINIGGLEIQKIKYVGEKLREIKEI